MIEMVTVMGVGDGRSLGGQGSGNLGFQAKEISVGRALDAEHGDSDDREQQEQSPERGVVVGQQSTGVSRMYQVKHNKIPLPAGI
jgi:hypothetical protein